MYRAGWGTKGEGEQKGRGRERVGTEGKRTQKERGYRKEKG